MSQLIIRESHMTPSQEYTYDASWSAALTRLLLPKTVEMASNLERSESCARNTPILYSASTISVPFFVN